MVDIATLRPTGNNQDEMINVPLRASSQPQSADMRTESLDSDSSHHEMVDMAIISHPAGKDEDEEVPSFTKLTSNRELAKLMSTDHDLAILRRFDELNILQLMTLQDDIVRLRDQMEASCNNPGGKKEPLATPVADHGKIQQEMRNKLSEYSTSSVQT